MSTHNGRVARVRLNQCHKQLALLIARGCVEGHEVVFVVDVEPFCTRRR